MILHGMTVLASGMKHISAVSLHHSIVTLSASFYRLPQTQVLHQTAPQQHDPVWEDFACEWHRTHIRYKTAHSTMILHVMIVCASCKQHISVTRLFCICGVCSSKRQYRHLRC